MKATNLFCVTLQIFTPIEEKKKVMDVQIQMQQKKRSRIYEAKKSVAKE